MLTCFQLKNVLKKKTANAFKTIKKEFEIVISKGQKIRQEIRIL